MSLLVYCAKVFAKFAHSSINHRRKYTNLPYWHHCNDVAKLVEDYGGSPEAIAAAWLHDTVEDTWVKHWMIRLLFGERVAEIVKGLTDVTTLTDGNRAKRKEIERARLTLCDAETQTVKICDLIDNAKSIYLYDARFSKVYQQEASQLHESLTLADRSAREHLGEMLCLMAMNREETLPYSARVLAILDREWRQRLFQPMHQDDDPHWRRASKDCRCEICGLRYQEHPIEEQYHIDHRLCNGDIVHL